MLKVASLMKGVGLMNNVRIAAEEIVQKEMIYVWCCVGRETALIFCKKAILYKLGKWCSKGVDFANFGVAMM